MATGKCRKRGAVARSFCLPELMLLPRSLQFLGFCDTRNPLAKGNTGPQIPAVSE